MYSYYPGSDSLNNLPGQTQQPKTPPPFSGSLPATAAPPVPPNPLAGIGDAIKKQQSQQPVAPISLQGGKVNYKPTIAPYGYDMSTPGVREQFWNDNQDMWFNSPSLDWVDAQLPQFQDPWYGEQWNQQNMAGIGAPGAGQQYWNGVSGSANTMTGAEKAITGGYKGPNNAQTAFDMTKERIPGSLQPQFDAYYDRMKDKVMSDVNSQSAARGVYGSNSALNNSIGAGLDVEANRAKAATDFSLEDSANQRAWLDSLGNQGRNADLSGLGIFDANRAGAQYGLDKTKTLGDLAFRSEEMGFNKNKAMSDIAFGIDEHRADRLGAGVSTAFGSNAAHRGQLNDAYDAAGQAQNARENRIGGLYNDVGNMENDVMSFFSKNYDQLLNADESTFDETLSTMIAKEADQRGWDQQQQERIMRDAKTIWDMVKGKESEKAAGVATGGAGG